MDRSTTDRLTSFDDRELSPRTGDYMRVIATGLVFYTARPDNYTRTLAHRETYQLCTNDASPPVTEEPIKLEATHLGGRRYAVRPLGQLGTCGFYPRPWTAAYVNAGNYAEAIMKVATRDLR